MSGASTVEAAVAPAEVSLPALAPAPANTLKPKDSDSDIDVAANLKYVLTSVDTASKKRAES